MKKKLDLRFLQLLLALLSIILLQAPPYIGQTEYSVEFLPSYYILAVLISLYFLFCPFKWGNLLGTAFWTLSYLLVQYHFLYREHILFRFDWRDVLPFYASVLCFLLSIVIGVEITRRNELLH